MGVSEIRSCCARRSEQRILLVVMVSVAGTAAAFAQGKAPVPDAAAQARAQELLHDVYGKEYEAAETSKEKTELAKKLLDQAAKTQGDAASHFVLLRVAKDVALLAADAETALEALNRIVATYDVDAMEMRLDCVKGLADAAKFSSQHAAVAEQAYSLVDIALAEDDFEAARQFGQIAQDSAKRGRSYSLLKEVVARMEALDELQQAHAEYEKAVARLEENPTDPEANLAAGRYLCLSRGDWERGVSLLALGSDPALKAPAVNELAGADSPDAQVALGDAWWDLAQIREGRERESFLFRAGHWYEKARPKVTSGLARVRLRKRLEEIGKVGRLPAEVTVDRPRPRERPPSKKRPASIREVQSWDPAAAQPVRILEGHKGPVHGIAFSPDSSILISVSSDKTLAFWDAASGRLRRMFPASNSALRAVAISPDGALAATGGGEFTIRLWDTAKGQVSAELHGHTSEVMSLAISPDGATLASGSNDNTVKLWDVATGKLQRTMEGHTRRARWVVFSPDGSTLASASLDGTFRLWNPATGEVRRVTKAGPEVRSLAFSPNGGTLASGYRSGTITLWDVDTGELQRTLTGHTAALVCLDFHPDGSLLASGSWDGTVRIWNPATGKILKTLSGPGVGQVNSITFSPNGSMLAFGGNSSKVQLWWSPAARRRP